MFCNGKYLGEKIYCNFRSGINLRFCKQTCSSQVSNRIQNIDYFVFFRTTHIKVKLMQPTSNTQGMPSMRMCKQVCKFCRCERGGKEWISSVRRRDFLVCDGARISRPIQVQLESLSLIARRLLSAPVLIAWMATGNSCPIASRLLAWFLNTWPVITRKTVPTPVNWKYQQLNIFSKHFTHTHA